MPRALKEMLTALRHLPNVQLPPQSERAEDLIILVMDRGDLVPGDPVMDPGDLAMAPDLVRGDLVPGDLVPEDLVLMMDILEVATEEVMETEMDPANHMMDTLEVAMEVMEMGMELLMTAAMEEVTEVEMVEELVAMPMEEMATMTR